MNPKGYKQVKEIFQAALDVAPDERAAFLDVDRLVEALDAGFVLC